MTTPATDSAATRFRSLLEPKIDREHPLKHLLESDWYFEYIETHDLYLSNKATLDAALDGAPDKVAYGYVYSLIEVRERIAILSGIAFD
jgi:hypothetical protein